MIQNCRFYIKFKQKMFILIFFNFQLFGFLNFDVLERLFVQLNFENVLKMLIPKICF